MPYVTVPRDLSTVKNKLAMGLTLRQLLAVGTAGVLCLPIYLLTMGALGDLAIYVAVIPAIPCFLVGFYQSKDGRHFDAVMGNYIQVRYKQPRVRPYQTQNIYASLAAMHQIEEVVQQYENKTNSEPGDNQEDQTD